MIPQPPNERFDKCFGFEQHKTPVLTQLTHPKKYAFFVSQKSLVPAWGNISFCRISLAYLILFSLVTPGRAPRAPMKFKATFCS